MNIVVIDGISCYFYFVDGNGQITNHGKIDYPYATGIRYSLNQKYRKQKVQKYIDKCIEKIEEIYDKSKDKTLYLSGPGSVKTRLKNNLLKVSKDWKNIKLLDTQYGGENGLFQVVE